MRIENRLITFIYRFILFTVGLIALFINLFGINDGFDSNLLFYFTIQSNIFCLLVLLYMIIKEGLFNKSFSKAMYIIKAIVMVEITVTCIVYAFFLMPVYKDQMETFTFHNIVLHFALPIGFFIDYLLFDEKGHQKWFNPILSLIYPIIYAIITFVRAASLTENKYLYPFLDIDVLGITQVVQNVIVIIFAITVLGFVYFGLDKLLGLGNRKKIEVIDTNFFLRK